LIFLDRLLIGHLWIFLHRFVRHELARFGALVDSMITAGTLIFCHGTPRKVTKNRIMPAASVWQDFGNRRHTISPPKLMPG